MNKVLSRKLYISYSCRSLFCGQLFDYANAVEALDEMVEHVQCVPRLSFQKVI
jgi:hypothetical protein